MSFIVNYRQKRYPFLLVNSVGALFAILMSVGAAETWRSSASPALFNAIGTSVIAMLSWVVFLGWRRAVRPKAEAIQQGGPDLVADSATIEIHDWRGRKLLFQWQDVDSLHVQTDRRGDVLFIEGSYPHAAESPARVAIDELETDGRSLLFALGQLSGRPAIYRGELI